MNDATNTKTRLEKAIAAWNRSLKNAKLAGERRLCKRTIRELEARLAAL